MGDSPPSAWQLFLVFLRLGAVSFGGPAMIAYIKQQAVTRRGWLTEAEFRNGVALCQAIPGATALQCAAYVGWRTRRLAGAIAAYAGFGLPAFLVMLALAALYATTSDLPRVAATLTGLQALVVALIANSTLVFGRSSIRRLEDGFLVAATAALFLLRVNPLLIVGGAGLVGLLLFRRREAGTIPTPPQHRASTWQALQPPLLILLCAVLVLALCFALDRKLGQLGLVMARIDLFAFGGGFASLPLMFHEVVTARGWVPAKEFLDGIALGQVTPGPIVITATFVGYQVAGVVGAVVATVCIFAPSLFVLLLVEPWFDRLQSSPLFRAAVHGGLLSFVGLLASATIQFGRAATWSVPSALIALAALTALLLKADVLWVVLAGALVSAIAM